MECILERKTFKPYITDIGSNGVYVYFGNTVGRLEHPATHKLFKAKWGVVSGMNGQCYAITAYIFNNYPVSQLSKEFILTQIKKFYLFALRNPDKNFYVTYYGSDTIHCKMSPKEMAELFSLKVIPENVIFDEYFNSFIK